MHPSNSPNGLVGVAAPRRGDSYGHVDIFESFAASHMPPASSITTSAPASQSTFAAMPPPAPEPTIQTSYVLDCRMICMTAQGTPSRGFAVRFARGTHDRKEPRRPQSTQSKNLV